MALPKKWLKLAAQIVACVLLAWLTVMWWGKPNVELVWYLLPIAGLFRMVGGTWSHDVGRYLFVAAFVMAYFFFIGWTWWLIAMAGAYFGVKTLPVTLIGDSIPEHWLNWVWIWALGFITGLPVLIPGILTGQAGLALLSCLVPTAVFGLFITLSNVKATSKIFVWKLCEFAMGVSVAYPLCAVIQNYVPII